jgi:peptide/nickel transport system permease protein
MAETVASVTVAGAGVRVRRRRPSYLRADLALGSVIIGFWLLCALFPTLFTDVDPTAISDEGTTLLGEPLPPGSDGYPLGTDALGRDFLSRLVHGARVAMLMAVVPNFLALLLAMLVGVTAGMVRGKVEFVLMRVTEAFMVLPGFLIAMAVIATFGTSTTVLIFTLVTFSWTYTARVVYGETLRIRESLFVESARAIGASTARIAVVHVIPQLKALLIIYFTMNAAFMVLLEAGLGFLGFGVQPPTPSWGAMLAEARDQFYYPWIVILPGACLASLCVGFYAIGNGLQNAGSLPEKRVEL